MYVIQKIELFMWFLTWFKSSCVKKPGTTSSQGKKQFFCFSCGFWHDFKVCVWKNREQLVYRGIDNFPSYNKYQILHLTNDKSKIYMTIQHETYVLKRRTIEKKIKITRYIYSLKFYNLINGQAVCVYISRSVCT